MGTKDFSFKFGIGVAKKVNNTTKRNSSNYVTKVCKTCGKEFVVATWYGKGEYCSKECADAAKVVTHKPNVVCEYCGKEFYRKPSQLANVKHICCSKQCMGELRKILYSGENNPNFNNRKDEIVVYNNGHKYIEIHVNNHPYSHKLHNVGEYYKQHRFVVEQNHELFDDKYFDIINGSYYLKPEVDVHHKNEVTTDNRIENLIPLFRSEHTSEHNTRKIIIRDTKTGKITGVIKQGELLENHKASDNQQPNIDSNIDKGSTTNSRVLIDNAKDSNADKSALPNNV